MSFSLERKVYILKIELIFLYSQRESKKNMKSFFDIKSQVIYRKRTKSEITIHFHKKINERQTMNRSWTDVDGKF